MQVYIGKYLVFFMKIFLTKLINLVRSLYTDIERKLAIIQADIIGSHKTLLRTSYGPKNTIMARSSQDCLLTRFCLDLTNKTLSCMIFSM